MIPDMSLCLQHADLAQLVNKEKQRFDLWPDKMAKLDDAARQSAETLAQLEREHQDQVAPAISICCTFTSTKIKRLDISRPLYVLYKRLHSLISKSKCNMWNMSTMIMLFCL